MNQVPAMLSENDCQLTDFAAVVEVETSKEHYPHCADIADGVVVYESALLDQFGSDQARSRALKSELAHALLHGPGIVVFRAAVSETAIQAASDQFFAIIEDEKQRNVAAGDHFAKPGSNDRIWNALEKLALRDPKVFTDYYRARAIDFVSESWLGPNYQVTSQVNVVNPGGAAQQPHRDYHLGFMSNNKAGQFPEHVHRLSPLLTLQGAVAHVDMPVETGPTLYLPHSQKYIPGYLAWRQPDFVEYFEANHVQLALKTGDAVFFNPALFHAAGTNRTSDVRRIANLLQVSSAMGRAMEQIDRTKMVLAVYPELLAMDDEGAALRALASTAEGYAFPGDLDRDQPVDGLSPPSQADLVREALQHRWPLEQLAKHLVSPGIEAS